MKVDLASELSKRKRWEQVEEIKQTLLQKAQARLQTIRQLNLDDLADPSKITRLPYPGYGDPETRPVENAAIVGMPDLYEMLDLWAGLGDGHSILLVGPKGVGKSSRLRAFACHMYATLPKGSKNKLLCIWNANLDMSYNIQAALLFCYCEKPEVWKTIKGIDSLNGYHKFMSEREEEHDESFFFIVDAAQRMDVNTCFGKEHIDAAERLQQAQILSSFVRDRNTFWGISPRAGKLESDEMNPGHFVHSLTCTDPLDMEAMKTFMEHSILGAILEKFPEYEIDVQYYAASYPLFLDILQNCCRLVAKNKERNFLLAQGKTRKEVVAGLASLTQPEMVDVLADKEDWANVLAAFEEDREIKSISKSFAPKTTTALHSKVEMMEADARYVLDKNKGLYCSPYVESLYIDLFRALEGRQGLAGKYGAWVAYTAYLLKDANVNWAEIGWHCERLCTDVVSKFGICIAAGLNISALKPMRFSKIPELERLQSGGGVVYIPNRFIYGCVDGIIIYRDMSGQLHFIGLQFTTSVERHQHSADQFMSLSVVGEWIPSILSLSRDGTWKLHFVFVCLTGQDAQVRPERICELRKGAHYGVLEHTLHVRMFGDAFGLDRVEPNVYKILMEFAKMREEQYAMDEAAPPFPDAPSTTNGPLKVTKAQLRKIKRANLNAIAKAGGLSPENYRTIDALVEAMKTADVLLVEE